MTGQPALVGDIIAALVRPGGTLDMRAIRELMADDHPDPGAIERAEAALRTRHRKAGDFWWFGDVCLQCQGMPPAGAPREHKVATFDEETRTSACPDCGGTVHWQGEPGLRDDPRCALCASGRRCPLCGDVAELPRPANAMGDALCADCAGWTWPSDECAPTERACDLPPALPGIRDAGAGGQPLQGEP